MIGQFSLFPYLFRLLPCKMVEQNFSKKFNQNKHRNVSFKEYFSQNQLYYLICQNNYHLLVWMTDSNHSFQTAIVVLSSLQLLIYIIFLGFYIRRINKLDKQATVSVHLPNKKANAFRIALVALLIILMIVHIMLSFFDKYYWMNEFKQLCLVNVLGIVNLLLQIYIIKKQNKKNSRRTRTLIVNWILLALVYSVVIIVVMVIAPNTAIVLVIFTVIDLGALIGLTISLQIPTPPNIESFQDSLRQSNLLPIVGDAQRASFTQSQKIYIEFSKDFEVHMKENENFEYYFKIAVYVGGQSHIITKTQEDFIELSKKLQQTLPNSEIVKLTVSNRRTATNAMKYGEEKQKTYERYLIQLTRNSQFYVGSLIIFLEIDPSKRVNLVHHGRIQKKETIDSDDDKLQQPFFSVKSKDNKIYVTNHQILELKIYKTELEIKAFHHKLIAEKRLKVELLSQNSELSEMMYFIDRVVNSKYLWRSFAQWMRLGITLEDKIFNMFDFWSLGFRNIEVGIIGHEIGFDKQGSVVNLYLLSMSRKNSPVKDRGTTLKKRFKDFVKLDIYIRKFIEQRKMKVSPPTLPPKLSPFGTKTSPTARQVYLDTYIKELVKIDKINHCIKMLEFLQVHNDTVAEQFYTLDDSTTTMIDMGLSLHKQMLLSDKSSQSKKDSEDIFFRINLQELQLQQQ